MGYIFHHQEQQKVVVSKHATFLEREFLVKEAQGTMVDLDECPEDEPTREEIEETVGEPEPMVLHNQLGSQTWSFDRRTATTDS